MKEPRIFEYAGNDLTVRYDAKRCIHAKECVNHLPEVFDPKKRPWIEPDKAKADKLAEVIMRCPTGALHFTRHQDGAPETTSTENHLRVLPNGPLYLEGSLQLLNAAGEVVMQENRMALCRCGQSQNKPFCDNAHIEAGFKDTGTVTDARANEIENAGILKLTMLSNGPILAQGAVRVASADGTQIRDHEKAALCRCGASNNKPYCDGSHVSIDFETD